MIPDTTKNSVSVKGRTSPRVFNSGASGDQQSGETSQRKHNTFYTAIQGKGINVNGMAD